MNALFLWYTSEQGSVAVVVEAVLNRLNADNHFLRFIQPFVFLAVYLSKTICKILGYRLFPSSDMLLVWWIWKRIACTVTLPYWTLWSHSQFFMHKDFEGAGFLLSSTQVFNLKYLVWTNCRYENRALRQMFNASIGERGQPELKIQALESRYLNSFLNMLHFQSNWKWIFWCLSFSPVK